MNKKIRGRLTLLITAIIWGTTFVAQSEGMDHLGPFTFNAARTLLGGVILIPVVFILDKLTPADARPSPEDRKATIRTSVTGGVICGVILFAASSFQQCGMVMTSAGKAGFITALYIIIVPLLGFFVGKRVPWTTWICVAAAIVGFWLLCVNEDFTVSKYDLLVLCCALVFSLHILTVDKFVEKGVNGVLMSCVQFFVAGTIMLIVAFLAETPTWEAVITGRYSILYAGIMSCGVAYTLQIIGQRDCDPTSATLIMSLESVIAALSDWILPPHNVLSPKGLIGAVMIFAAVLLAQFPIPDLIAARKNKKEG